MDHITVVAHVSEQLILVTRGHHVEVSNDNKMAPVRCDTQRNLRYIGHWIRIARRE